MISLQILGIDLFRVCICSLSLLRIRISSLVLHLLAFVPFNSADRHLIEAENVNHVGIYLKMVVVFAKFKPSDVFYAQSFLRVFSWVQCGGTNNSSF